MQPSWSLYHCNYIGFSAIAFKRLFSHAVSVPLQSYRLFSHCIQKAVQPCGHCTIALISAFQSLHSEGYSVIAAMRPSQARDFSHCVHEMMRPFQSIRPRGHCGHGTIAFMKPFGHKPLQSCQILDHCMAFRPCGHAAIAVMEPLQSCRIFIHYMAIRPQEHLGRGHCSHCDHAPFHNLNMCRRCQPSYLQH